MQRAVLVLAALLAAAACTHGAGGAESAAAPRPALRHNPDVIAAAELATVAVSTLEDAVRTLRPAWLRHTSTAVNLEMQAPIVVYQNRLRLGGPEALRAINPAQVKEVRYYGPAEATALFGPGHANGAIQVTMLPGR